jgi:hypothetical protein
LTWALGTRAILDLESHPEETTMPQILVVADKPHDSNDAIVYRERVAPTDLESDHFSGQLIERVGWAVLDADQLEHTNEAEK